MQVLSRKDRYEPFDCTLLDFAKPLKKLSDYVHLRLEMKFLETFFSEFKDGGLLNEANYLIKSFACTFFKSLSASAINIDNKIISFSVPFDQGWYFLDYTFNRLQQGGFKSLCALVVADLLEQIWCKAKAQRVSTEISSFVDSVSRPWSAFNRLGSFICWERPYGEEERDQYKRLADEGFIWDETTKAIRKVETGIVNVPLINSLNYLSRLDFNNELNDVIVSPNTGYALIGLTDGRAHIINTTLPCHLSLKTINFFPNLMEKAQRNVISMQLQDIQYKTEDFMG